MLVTNSHSSMLCRVFVFVTTTNYTDLLETLVNHFVQAGLSFYIPDDNTRKSSRLSEMLKQEIAIADIVIFIAGISLGPKIIDGKSLVEYSFDYSQEIGKPILAYITDEIPSESDAIRFRKKLTEQLQCGRICSKENATTANVIKDIAKLVFSEKNMTHWTRADISRDDIGKTISEMDKLNRGLLRSDALIGEYESRLDKNDRNALVGHLIDAGLRYNSTGRAHNFVVGHIPRRELQRNEFEYQYYLGRFAKYSSFRKYGHAPIYDNMLKVSWFFVQKQPFTWHMAMDWQAHINDRDKNILQEIDKDGFEQWQVPSIEQLMTLLSFNPCADVYIDTAFFPNDTHWFWSSTKGELLDQEVAYYIETSHCQVLLDAIHEGSNAHFKGLLLCRASQLADDLFPGAIPRLSDDKLKELKRANETKRIFGIYLSAFPSDVIGSEGMHHIWKMLARHGYIVSTPVIRNARNLPQYDFIQRELSNSDFYVLIFSNENKNGIDVPRVQRELEYAYDSHIPIFVFTNLKKDEYAVIMKNVLEVHREIDDVIYSPNLESLPLSIPMTLNNYKTDFSALGWIKKSDFETINRGIDEINRTFDSIGNSKFIVEEFIQKCEVDGLRERFEECNVLLPTPKYGVNTRFVSRDTPIQRLMTPETSTEKELPILYNTIIDRFELQPRNDEKRVVRDNFLNLYWWTDVNKHTTYEEALAWAEKISELDSRDWRLPSVGELLTLITARRGTRKYMDESIFHTGRWFWTGTRTHDSIYYIDFNYMPDAVRLERHLPENEFDTIRKKSALLVSDVTQMSQCINVFISYASEESRFVKEVIQTLQTHQIRFWEYQNSLHPGTSEWDTAVEKAMNESDIMLLIWSRAASKSREVHNEWNHYLKTGQPMIILVYDTTELHFRLDLIQHITYSPKEREKCLQIVRQSIKRLYK